MKTSTRMAGHWHAAASAGRRVGIMTNSGGPATAIAYTCDLAGLEVPRFSESLQKEIKQYIELMHPRLIPWI